ncbi:uncharacterized protein BP5553_05017 [Venustampulla echinocandica]|uniref:Nucleotidyl transferase AbiEii/AbiGii toxin family protein n=1 Tax=Venustampulla echinocandica TaxID=2656787 RepID=A0A370TPY2_9HELO|nr:uncharacterized protein BP5553_05017 [Venustampulla echinocandica]RDL37584.1 hypothetical protein BP5553_05017 [Venustampulla echinocandica]
MSLSSRQPPKQAAQPPPGTYTVAEGFSLAQKAATETTVAHLCSAADFLARVFEVNNVPFAFMGGYSLWLRGSNRHTNDIDLTVGCDMNHLINIIKSQQRILRPQGPVSGTIRLFVRTGGVIENQGLPDLFTEADVMLSGTLGAPDDPQTAFEIVTREAPIGERSWPVLNISTLMSSKLGAFFGRGQGSPHSKDYIDIMFLANKYREAVYAIRTQLNATHKQHVVNTYIQASKGTGNEKKVKAIKYIFGCV